MRDPLAASGQQLNVFKRTHVGTTQNAQGYPGVVFSLARGDQLPMPGVAFSAGQTARGIDGRQFINFIECNFLNLRPRLPQQTQAALKSAGNRTVQSVLHVRARDRQPAGRQRLACQHNGPRRQNLVHRNCIAHRAGQGAHGVQAGRKWNCTGRGHELRRTFEADDAAQGRRNADGTAGIRTQAHKRGPAGHGYRRA